MNTAPLEALADRWQDEADLLRRRGAPGQADALESAADDLRATVTNLETETVTLEEASELGGYSYSRLQHLVSEGEIPNAGEPGAPRIRRSDVPVKPGHDNGHAPGTAARLDAALEVHRD